jgi:uncharacterized protein
MNEQRLITTIADELKLNPVQVKNTMVLLDQQNTIPFIARYRKEHTGNLDEDQLRAIQERLHYLRALDARRQTVLHTIKKQGKLTPELKNKIEAATTLQDLEDLYLPFRPKKRTRATAAKEKGLEKLAHLINAQEIIEGDPESAALPFVNPEKGIRTVGEALQGAQDILAEYYSEEPDMRQQIRKTTFEKGYLISKVRPEHASQEYQMYFDYSEAVVKMLPHRILAINRGEKEKCLKVSLDVPAEIILQMMIDKCITNPGSIFYNLLIQTLKDAYTRLIAPAIARDIRSQLTEMADNHAIQVFAVNLKNLLLQTPVSGKIIMGIDPGYRTGCKVAIIDPTGKYLKGITIYPHPPQKDYFNAKTAIRILIEKYKVDLIAIGNGTASRETELLVAELIREIKHERAIYYTIVSEAGASVYSTSPVAKKEFPHLEASMRGNISIARRLLDPLAELVKIDPKSIGVGLYQHDVNQRKLSESLGAVVESCVNLVGVDLNTASVSLLKYISGLNDKTATNIVKYREAYGSFKNREKLKEIDGMGAVTFQQSAGFLRISKGDNPLDATSIHPESYPVTQQLLKKFMIADVHQGGRELRNQIQQKKINMKALAEELTCGLPTLEDILLNLEKPGRDPREEMPTSLFRADILKPEDLKEGMILKGTVRNVVDFGAFIDIGVKYDGLVHLSQMAEKYIKSPHEIISVGDIVDVKVLSVDIERQRIALSMKIKP